MKIKLKHRLYALRVSSASSLVFNTTKFHPSTVVLSYRPKSTVMDIIIIIIIILFFFLLALQPPLGVVFYSPLVGFSLLACEVS